MGRHEGATPVLGAGSQSSALTLADALALALADSTLTDDAERAAAAERDDADLEAAE